MVKTLANGWRWGRGISTTIRIVCGWRVRVEIGTGKDKKIRRIEDENGKDMNATVDIIRVDVRRLWMGTDANKHD